ncbi:MAG: hypothetical protein WCY80_06670 [Candidatus Izemoplasmatales bacterium]
MEKSKRNNLIYSSLLVLGISVFLFLLSLLANDSDVFVFWGNSSREISADLANASIRNTDNFDWTFIFIFTVVVYVYFSELKNKNYRGIAAGLALYGVHWLYEIVNAIIQSASGYALWTVSPESTSLILLIGVSWELSMMFAIAGLIMSKLLPADKNMKILGMNNRLVFAIMNAAFFSIFEIFLAGTPAFIWTYSWWGTIPVFITTYIPFFLAAFLIYDAKDKTKKIFISSVWALVVLLLIILIPLGVI